LTFFEDIFHGSAAHLKDFVSERKWHLLVAKNKHLQSGTGIPGMQK